MSGGAAAGDSGFGPMQAPSGGVTRTDNLALPDGNRLFYRNWIGHSADAVLIVHGLGGHGGWYVPLGNFLASQGISVWIPDLRGFGQSTGERGHIDRGLQLIDDLSLLAKSAQETGRVDRLHLVGHSLGAVLSVHLAYRMAFQTLTAVNPWIEDSEGVSPNTVARIALQGLWGSHHRWRLGPGVKAMTEDPEARARLSRDPLWTRDQTARFLLQMTLLRVNALRTAREVKTPALVIQSGGDSVVQHDASARLFARLGATDKEWASPPGGLHDFELGPEMEEVAQLITMWVQTHGEKRDALSAQFR